MSKFNCKIKNRNCKIIEAKPIQIVRHFLSDGSELMTTLYYSVGFRNQPNYIRITDDILKYYLEKYDYRLESRDFYKTWHIHSKKNNVNLPPTKQT